MIIRTPLLTTVLGTILLVFSAVSHGATILVMGDSLSTGYGIPRGSEWPTLLDNTLKKHKVINASISGETTSGGLSRLPEALTKHKPELVILELGANDGLRGFPIPIMRSNLEQMIQLALQNNARVLLLGIHLPPNYGERYTQAFHRTFQSLAKKNQLGFIPFFLDGVATSEGMMQEDGLHPTAAAQTRILQNVLPAIKNELDKITKD